MRHRGRDRNNDAHRIAPDSLVPHACRETAKAQPTPTSIARRLSIDVLPFAFGRGAISPRRVLCGQFLDQRIGRGPVVGIEIGIPFVEQIDRCVGITARFPAARESAVSPDENPGRLVSLGSGLPSSSVSTSS